MDMSSASWPRVAVVGAGAVGGFFGGMLARAGARVTLIGRATHVDVWTRNGLFLDSLHFQETIPVEASTEIAAARDADLVLFCVKSLDTDDVARQLAAVVRQDALVLSLQNGVDNVDRMRRAGLDPIAAVVYVAAAMPAPGRVKHGGRGELIVGDLPGRACPARGDALAQVSGWFEAAHVPCRVSGEVEADLWVKLLANAGLNAISAIAHATYGEIAANAEACEVVRQLIEECAAVARAAGVRLAAVDYAQKILDFARDTGAVYSSTSQDLQWRKRTEIDALNGFIVRRGIELNVLTPVNQTMVALVKLAESQFAPRT